MKKLQTRSPELRERLMATASPEPHPLFRVTPRGETRRAVYEKIHESPETLVFQGSSIMRFDVETSREEIAAFCERWQVTQLAIFGSVLREDFGPDSDVDLLVSFEDRARHTLFDMVRMEEELKSIFGREVDLVSRRGIERSPNYLRRKAILDSAELLYGS